MHIKCDTKSAVKSALLPYMEKCSESKVNLCLICVPCKGLGDPVKDYLCYIRIESKIKNTRSFKDRSNC